MLKYSEPVTVEEIERQEAVRSHDGRPFGFLNGRWEAMKAKARPGDELKRFGTDMDRWVGRGARFGVVLVRDGKVIEELVTLLS